MKEALNLIALGSAYGQKLRNAVAQELEAAIELQSSEGNTKRIVTKLTQLKSSLEELTLIVDKIMEYYTAQNLGICHSDHLSQEELKAMKEKVCHVSCQLKVGEFHRLFVRHQNELQTTEENIMCYILGMGEDFAHFLQALDVDTRNHQCDFYFLERFIENKESELQAECSMDQTLGHEGLIENLQKLGFTRRRAQTISETIPDDLIDLQIPSFWAMRYFDYVFSYYPLFSSFPRYPHNGQVVDEFFKQRVPLDERPEPEDSLASPEKFWEVDMINVSSQEKCNKIITDFLKKQMDAGGNKLFFHGTAHDYACSILQKGIVLSKGKHSQDFSSGDGFYVSESFENARKWSKACTGGRQAVIVFRVEETLIDSTTENGFDLTVNQGEWKDVVGLCRRDYDNRKLKKKLGDFSFIYGPMCFNPKDVMKGQVPQGFGRQEMQLCVRDDEYAERFGHIENICCIIFH